MNATSVSAVEPNSRGSDAASTGTARATPTAECSQSVASFFVLSQHRDTPTIVHPLRKHRVTSKRLNDDLQTSSHKTHRDRTHVLALTDTRHRSSLRHPDRQSFSQSQLTGPALYPSRLYQRQQHPQYTCIHHRSEDGLIGYTFSLLLCHRGTTTIVQLSHPLHRTTLAGHQRTHITQ